MNLLLDPMEIERICAEQGITSRQLARSAGVHDKTIARALRGEPVRIESARGIARALKVKPSDLAKAG